MSNPWYSRTYDVLPGSTNFSTPVEDQFQRIEEAFDALDVDLTADIDDILAQLALKAPLASPALTGTPTAPTPSVSDDSTKIATTAFVQDVLGAGGALLPPQASHAGEALFTDGTSAYWGPVEAAGSVAWDDITGKPTTLDGYGITNGQHAIEWLQDGRRVTTAPVRIDFENATVRRVGQDTVRIRVEDTIPHNLLILAGVH